MRSHLKHRNMALQQSRISQQSGIQTQLARQRQVQLQSQLQQQPDFQQQLQEQNKPVVNQLQDYLNRYDEIAEQSAKGYKGGDIDAYKEFLQGRKEVIQRYAGALSRGEISNVNFQQVLSEADTGGRSYQYYQSQSRELSKQPSSRTQTSSITLKPYAVSGTTAYYRDPKTGGTITQDIKEQRTISSPLMTQYNPPSIASITGRGRADISYTAPASDNIMLSGSAGQNIQRTQQYASGDLPNYDYVVSQVRPTSKAFPDYKRSGSDILFGKAESSVQRDKFAQAQLYGMGGTVLSGVEAVKNLPRDVANLPRTAYSFVTNPIGTLKEVGTQYKRNPPAFISYFGTQALLTGGISKGIGKKLTTSELITEKNILYKTAEATTEKGLVEEFKLGARQEYKVSSRRKPVIVDIGGTLSSVSKGKYSQGILDFKAQVIKRKISSEGLGYVVAKGLTKDVSASAGVLQQTIKSKGKIRKVESGSLGASIKVIDTGKTQVFADLGLGKIQKQKGQVKSGFTIVENPFKNQPVEFSDIGGKAQLKQSGKAPLSSKLLQDIGKPLVQESIKTSKVKPLVPVVDTQTKTKDVSVSKKSQPQTFELIKTSKEKVKSQEPLLTITKSTSKEASKSKSRTEAYEISFAGQIQKQQQKQVQLERQGQKELQKQQQKELQKQQQKELQLQKQIQKQLQVQKNINIFGGGGGFVNANKPSLDRNLLLSALRKVKRAYQLQIKKGGKFIDIGLPQPLGKATRRGAEIVSTSLSRRFRLLARGTTAERDIPFMPSSKIFRESVVRRGREISTPLMFTERRGQTLKNVYEIGAIQKARKESSIFSSSGSSKKKRKKFNWF